METSTSGQQIGDDYNNYTFHATNTPGYVLIYGPDGSLVGSGSSIAECKRECDRMDREMGPWVRAPAPPKSTGSRRP